MADGIIASPSIAASTRYKLQKYKELLRGSDGASTGSSYWDIIVLTGRDENQKQGYEQQIKVKKARKEIPSNVKYLVFSDPPGVRIGSGGATMHALEQLQAAIPMEELIRCKVMLVHAGGFSQRLPHLSAVGKIFLTLPCGNPIMQMLEVLLVMFIDFPEKMNPGVFLAASDVIFLYNSEGEWDLKGSGITAIGHPAPLSLAKNHGVYILNDMTSPWKKYQQEPEKPSIMASVKCFVHKQTPEQLKDNGAIISGIDKVYVDLAYFMDFYTVNKLTKFYSENKPLTCEIDAYADFLQALGQSASIEYCRKTLNMAVADENLVATRENIFNLLQGTNFRVVLFHEAQFNHVGTLKECIYHLSENHILINALQFEPETMVHDSHKECEDKEPQTKVTKVSSFDRCTIMHSIIDDKNSVSIGAGSIIEYTIVGKGVKIGKQSVLSNVVIPDHSIVPDEVLLHTVPIVIDGKTTYATCAFGINENVKLTVSRERAMNLEYFGVQMDAALKLMGFDEKTTNSLWPKDVDCSLWTAKLFPILSTRKDSFTATVHQLTKIRGMQSSAASGHPTKFSFVSMADILKFKSSTLILAFHDELRSLIV